MTTGLGFLTDCIRSELQEVETLFHEELTSELSCVNTLIRHVSRFRGKMLRPSLVLLCGKACGPIGRSHVVVGTVVEMVHMATLVHDDVLDDAELRRKGATINHLRGNEAAVLLGDYLISHSYHLCSSLDSQLASRLIGRATNLVCEGELLQIDHRNDIDLDEETYLKIISRKTASLCATCCNLGARLAGAEESVAERLELFGLSLGIAFQIQDDILDLVGDENVVGKTLGSDIEKGKMTLPMIHFLAAAPPDRRVQLRTLLAGDTRDKLERIRDLVLPSDSIAYATNRARQLVERALAAIEGIDDSEALRVLQCMAEFVITRPM
jgi:octaprenyl-diphosphate synthase